MREFNGGVGPVYVDSVGVGAVGGLVGIQPVFGWRVAQLSLALRVARYKAEAVSADFMHV